MNDNRLIKIAAVRAQPSSAFEATQKAFSLMMLCASGLGLVLFVGGCVGSETQKSTGQYIDDATITTKVKAALIEDSVVSGLEINVETYKGTVQLNGFVDSQDQKECAEEIAQDVKGVEDVINNLTVKGTS
jgi:hypothetical protein